jgi:xanthine dehydrogenase accessory factor
VQHDSQLLFDGDKLVKVFGPQWRLLLIGAGELTRRVAQLGLTLDFDVTICDSRPEYAEGWRVDGSGFATSPPAKTLEIIRPDRRTAVLALSHTPALDDAALAAALNSDAFYIGALGSLSNQRARCKRLEKQGITARQLERLHGPVGLDIGSRTPAEIAIAIMAALIQKRNHHNQAPQEAETADG